MRGEGEDNSRSSLATHLWGAGIESLGRVRSTTLVGWGKSQNMALVARDPNTTITHSGGECFHVEYVNVGPRILLAL